MTTDIISKELDSEMDPEKADFDVDDYFAVRGWLWNPEEEDHSTEIGEGKGLIRFKEGGDAMEYYDKVKYNAFSAEDKGDIKIEFIHFRFSVPRIHKSRILFP